MTNQWSTMSGEIVSQLTPRGLARRLADAGIDVQVRRWLSNHGRQYIHVLDADDFTLSPVGMTRYQADAICASLPRLQTTTSLVSAVLTDLEIRHRFHLFSDRQPSVDYFHHAWPRGPANQCLKLYSRW